MSLKRCHAEVARTRNLLLIAVCSMSFMQPQFIMFLKADRIFPCGMRSYLAGPAAKSAIAAENIDSSSQRLPESGWNIARSMLKKCKLV